MIISNGEQGQVVISELHGDRLVTRQYFFMDQEEAKAAFREEFPDDV